jgi:hypothetical protein
VTVYDDDEGPLNFNVGALRSSIIVPGRLVVYGFTVYNTKGSAQFLNVFDASTLPGDTAVPLFSWPLAANAGVGFGFTPRGRQFQTGLVLCNSSTDATKTLGSADCFFDVQFDVYPQQNAPGTGE